MIRHGGEHEAHRQYPKGVPACRSQEQTQTTGDARTPVPQRGEVQERGKWLSVQGDPHQHQSGQAQGSSRPGQKPARHGVGDESSQVGESKTPDHQKAHARSQRAEHEVATTDMNSASRSVSSAELIATNITTHGAGSAEIVPR